jgi:hypothetical protein
MSTQQDSHPVRTSIISTVAGTVVVAGLAEVWPPIKSGLVWCWTLLKSFYNLFTSEYSTPGWILAILFTLSIISVARLMATLLRKNVAEKSEEKAQYQSYNTDIFYGAKWRWRWNAQEIENLWCFCPSCDSELVYDDSSCRDVLRVTTPRTDFYCEHCGHNLVTSIKGGNKSYAESAIQREIRRKLRTGQALTSVRTES